ncbi:MAG: hypothetical protein AMXMBFR34_17060 [Myxococcaceae bacterium]
MHPLQVKKVPLDWCDACRALWFDRGELALALGVHGAPAMTREQPASRCPACRGLLWFSKVDGSDVLACVDCAGCFVTEAALKKRGAVPTSGVEATFLCGRCGDRYRLREGTVATRDFECARCTPPKREPAEEPRGPVEDVLGRVVELVRRWL